MTIPAAVPALLLLIVGVVCFGGAVALAEAGGCGDEPSTLAEMAFYGLFGGGFVATTAGVYTSLRLRDTLRALVAFLVGLSAVFGTIVIAIAATVPECLS